MTLQHHGRENKRILPIPEGILRTSRYNYNLSRKDRPNIRPPKTCVVGRHNYSNTRYKKTTYIKIRISLNETRKRRIRSQQKEIKILPKKTVWLGHTISQDGIRPNKEITDAINKLSPPKNTKTLKSFLGAIQFFAKTLQNLSEKTDNMRQFLRKETKWEWTEEGNTDFKNLKKELMTQPCLAHYNGNKDTIVTTDACNSGLGLALWQRQNNGELKLIAFASRYLNDAEKNILSAN